MPNGDDKNWVRICTAVDGFRGRYGRWPAGVRLPPDYFEDVVGHILSPVGFAMVSSVFAIIPDDELSKRVAIIAFGEAGAEFQYGEHSNKQMPEPHTSDYFGPSVLREGLGCGLEYTMIHDAEGNVVWVGKGLQEGAACLHSEPKGKSMQLSEFLSQGGNAHKEQGNPVVSCNALYKNADNFNCYLTPSQAIALAQYLLQKARLILDEGLENTAVQMWNKGAANEKLYFGLIQARKGPRKGSKKPPPSEADSNT